jgi:hypothetical protein
MGIVALAGLPSLKGETIPAQRRALIESSYANSPMELLAA